MKSKYSRRLFKLLNKIGGKFILSSSISPITYKIADFLIKVMLEKDGTFEINGFKVKRGRTTRFAILTGEFEPSTIKLIKTEIKKGMKVFDLGANIGLFTLHFSKLVGEEGHVYAFEPDPELFRILETNVSINKLDNVSIFPLAVSNKSGIANFSLNAVQDGDNRLDSTTRTQNRIKIETVSLDDFCEQKKIKVDFLKMDVQGSEPKVFEGMKKSISLNPNLKIITEFYPEAIIDLGTSPKTFLDMLENAEFNIREIPDDVNKPLMIMNKKRLLRMKNEFPNLYCYKEF